MKGGFGLESLRYGERCQLPGHEKVPHVLWAIQQQGVADLARGSAANKTLSDAEKLCHLHGCNQNW